MYCDFLLNKPLFRLALMITSVASFANTTGKSMDGNLAMAWKYEGLSTATNDDGLGILDIRLEDSTTHQPIRYQPGQLAAWIQPNRNALSDSELACSDKVRMLATQGIGQRAEIDLNGWRLLTFNTDRTLAFINPFVGISNAKLESIVPLPGDIDSWVSQPLRLQLWIHVRDGKSSQLLQVDTHHRRIARTVSTPSGASALALDADTGGIWIASPEAQNISFLKNDQAGAALKSVVAANIVGMVSANTKGVYTWPSNAPAINLWQTASSGEPKLVRQWTLVDQPITAQWSQQSQRLLVALSGGQITWIDPAKPSLSAERTLHIGSPDTHINDFRLFDEGRRLLWVDSRAARAGVVDVASGRELLSTPVMQAVDNIAFSDGFAYLHSTVNARATLLSLADLRSGRAQPIEVTTGQPDPDAATGLRLATDPSQHGMLVANPVDGVVYQYAEGMMAPMGSYSNYSRSALGVLVLDTGLTEIEPGHFRAAVRNQQGGLHELVVSGTSPRFAACDQINLPMPTSSSDSAGTTPTVSATLEGLLPTSQLGNLTHTIRVQLTQLSKPGQSQPFSGVKDLTLLVFDRRTAWQQRIHMQEAEKGFYGALVRLPYPGRFDLQVRSVEHNIGYETARLGSHEVKLP
jgi:hypothetical protein